MKRTFICLLLAATPLAAQQSESKTVATVNGQTITAAMLDRMWERIGSQTRAQYEKAGGKATFLNNYINKILIVQEAMKSGFDKKPEVQMDVNAAKEAAIFDDYARDAIGSSLVKLSDDRAYYDEHKQDFAVPEKLHIRHIVVTEASNGPRAKSKDEAQQILDSVLAQLRGPGMTGETLVNKFADLAKQYSEDGVARSGGDLGFIEKGRLDPDFEAAAWSLPVGKPSGIVKSQYGYHIILVEAKQPASTKPFEQVRSQIHDQLLSDKMAEVMTALGRLTNELRANSRIAVYPENIK
jgi:peptidyl-prolyl cis-trans isomerase C